MDKLKVNVVSKNISFVKKKIKYSWEDLFLFLKCYP